MKTNMVSIDCWNCYEGYLPDSCSCMEDTCCCADPEPLKCHECNGSGVKWVHKDQSESV